MLAIQETSWRPVHDGWGWDNGQPAPLKMAIIGPLGNSGPTIAILKLLPTEKLKMAIIGPLGNSGPTIVILSDPSQKPNG